MPDNLTAQSTTPATIPSGSVIATDLLGDGSHAQKIKLLDGGDGSSTQLDKAEDAAHASGDRGLMLLAVRADTATALAGTDGDYIPLIVGSDGALYARLTQALPAGNNNIGDVDIASIAAGDTLVGRVKLSDGTTVATVRELGTNDALNVSVVDGSGNQVTSFGGSGGTQYAEDAAHVSGDLGTLSLVVRKDTAAVTAGTDGDYAALVVGSDGGLWTRLSQPLPAGTNAIGKLAANDGVDIGDTTVNNASGGSAVNIQDGGNSITVDGAVGISGVVDVTPASPAANDYLPVRLTDGSAFYSASSGGEVQYTEGDTDSTITGTALLWEDTSDTLRAVSAAKPLPISDAGGSVTVDGSVSVSGAVDTELTTADLDTGAGTDTRAVVGLVYGASGGGVLVSTTNPLPIGDNGGSLTIDATSLPLPTGAATETTLAAALTQSDFDTKVGSLTETAPATDTASSGLNGRLQRIAQRLTSIFGATGDTTDAEASSGNGSMIAVLKRLRTLLNGGLPAALGQTTMANSLAVVLPSNQQVPIVPTRATPVWTNITANNTDGIAAMDVSNYCNGTIQLTGTWSATVQVQFSDDGSNWLPGLTYGIGGDKAVATGLTGNSIYSFAIPPMSQMRIRTTGYSSGTIVGSVALSSVPLPTFVLGITPSNFVSLGDGASNTRTAPTSPLGDVDYPTFPRLYNGTNWDRERNVAALTLLSSSARTTTTNSSDQINYNWHGLLLTVDVSSAGTGSITPSIQTKDSISGNYKTIWTAATALTTNGTYVYALYPSSLGAASYTEVAQILVGRTWRLATVANNANSVTYSASADMAL
jgi:hypothetical protein